MRAKAKFSRQHYQILANVPATECRQAEDHSKELSGPYRVASMLAGQTGGGTCEWPDSGCDAHHGRNVCSKPVTTSGHASQARFLIFRSRVSLSRSENACATLSVAPSLPQESRKCMAKRKGQRGTVYQAGNLWWGKYRVDVPGSPGRIQKSVPIGEAASMTKTQARARLADIISELGINTVEHLERSLRPIRTFAERARTWIAETKASHEGDLQYARLKPSTFRSMQSIVKLHLQPRFGDRLEDEIRQQDAERLIEELAFKGKSKVTIKNIVVTLGIVLGRKFQTKDKLRSLKLVRLPARMVEQRNEVPWLTGQQMSAIIGAAKNKRSQAVLATAAGTGARAGELFALRVEDFNPQDGTITIRRSVWEGIEQTPKTPNAYRVIGIDASLIRFLREWLGDRKCGYLFPSRNGTPLRESNFVERELWPILDALKIPRCGLHAFRHGRVTVLVEAQVPEHTIRAWIGHGSRRMIERYTHSRPAYHQEHLRNVPMVIEGAACA
jgi:integrase